MGGYLTINGKMIYLVLTVLVTLCLSMRFFCHGKSVIYIYRITQILGTLTIAMYALVILDGLTGRHILSSTEIHPYYFVYAGITLLFLFITFGLSVLGRTKSIAKIQNGKEIL